MSLATCAHDSATELLVQSVLDFPINIDGQPFTISAVEIPQDIHGIFETSGYRPLVQSACLRRVLGIKLDVTGTPVYATHRRTAYPKLIFGFHHGVDGLYVAEGIQYPERKLPDIEHFQKPTGQQLALASALLDIMYTKAAREQFVPSQPYGRLRLAS